MNRRWALVALAAVAAPLGSATAPAAEPGPGPRLAWAAKPGEPEQARVEVSGLNASTLARLQGKDWNQEQWQRLLSVYAEFGDHGQTLNLPPMLGRYQVVKDGFRFEPAFKLTAGMKYRALFRPAQLPGNGGPGPALLSALHDVPARFGPATTVVNQVYPTADLLPENLLKFYVQFSAPMSRGHVYDHIRLRTAEGAKVDLAFLEIDEELWDPEARRLTLFIDPGRIKRGVRPLEEVGPALEEGRHYTLEVDQDMQDGEGFPLREGFRKTFRVGPPDRVPPDPDHWNIKAPRAGGRAPLTIDFGEALDHALASRLIVLTDQKDQAVAGRIELGRQERSWQLVPAKEWTAGSYRLVVGGMLEDLAGNSVGRPFEVDLFEKVERVVPKRKVTLDIPVRE